MGRRSKAELMGLIERIIKMYEDEKYSIKQIEAILNEEGYDISREAIRRSIKSSKDVAHQYRQAASEAKILIDTVRDNPNTDVVEITTNLLTKQLFDFVRNIDELTFEDPGELILAINRLSSAQVKISKQRLTYQNGYNQAKQDVMSRLKTELDKHPDLLGKLALIVSNLEARE